MFRRELFLTVTIVLIIMFLALTLPVYGDRGSTEPQQTWPSRTPTSAPPPTNPPPDGGGGDPTAVPPNETTSASTATSAVPSETALATTLTPTEAGRSISTAQACGFPPTIRALGLVTTRIGPGLDYPANGALTFSEVRPILGRAARAQWWLIQLTDSSQGWVSDQAISVQGFVGSVPIVDAPDINSETPTPGTLWNPTPNPICTPDAANQTEISTATALPRATIEDPLPTPTPESIIEEEIELTSTLAEPNDENADDTPATASPSAAGADQESSGFNLDIVLGLGVALLLAGSVVLILQRRGTG